MLTAVAIHLHAPASETVDANVEATRNERSLYDAVLIAFARREQGFLIATGNPLGIASLEHALQKRARFALRPPGAGAQLLLQSAVEAEVAAFLGRDRYERAASCGDPHPGMRNGYCPTTVKTTAGPVTLARPKLRGTTERFASQLFGKHVTKTNALESLVIAGFVRGLSTRDVEAALVEALGAQAAVSKSTVSRVCE